jgi:hypothetical protein
MHSDIKETSETVIHSETDNRAQYNKANDKTTFMTDMQQCLKKLEEQGYTDQYRVENKVLQSLTDETKRYKAEDVQAVNFYRFEGDSDPDDMSILFAIETNDGRKGTLIDAYGNYSDDDTGAFMQDVDTTKKTPAQWMPE